MLPALLLVLLSICSTQASPLSLSRIAVTKTSAVDYKLPTHIVPQHYTIELEPNFNTDTFNGSVTIEFTVASESNNITLHTRELQIDNSSITVLYQGEEYASIVNTTKSEDDKEFYVMFLSRTLAAGGTYSLVIKSFTGILNLDKAGFYLAKYTDENGVERKLATTQFESTSARRAFPCLDEPALKATFTLSIIRPENYVSISNTPKSSTDVIVTQGRYRDSFPTTVKMSTYLLAFIVSNFSSVQQGIYGVYAKKQEIEAGKGQYALETGKKVLEGIAGFVGVSYSLEKMDQAAIPDDYFAAGAMENWGLVTYREVYLLYSNVTSLTSQKQTICTIISHEFGHQWFGDLVSPKWWEYIWLNEGFATYFEYYGASLAEPKWDLMDQFVVKNLQYAFANDGLSTTRPMNTDAGSPADVSALFDRVAYEKAGSVIRMFETFLTTPVFQKGLQKYLTKKSYDAAEPSDLYSSLQEALDESTDVSLPDDLTVSKILTNWDSLAGYPVIYVSVDYDSKKVTFTQYRFLLKNDTNSIENAWIVPINYATESEHDFSDVSTDFWLTSANQTETIDSLGSDDWIIVNKQERGYYRVNYDEETWNRIIDFLNSDDYSHIHRLNRAQLVDDAFNLARSGRLDYSIAFQLAKYLERETDYFPFYSFFTALTFVNVEVAGSEEFDTIKQYVLDILSGVYEALGTEELSTDTHVDKLNRINVLNWLCKYGHSGCRDAAHTSLHNWKSSGVIIAPDLQTPFFCGAMAEADQEHWDFLYSQYESATEAALRTRILNGLGCSENDTILEGYLNKVVNTSSTLDSSHRATAFASIYNAGNIGLSYALNYLEEHHAEFDSATLSTIAAGISAKLTTTDQIDKLKAIVEEEESLTTAVLSSAEENLEWTQKHLTPIESWFKLYKADNDATTVRASIFVAILFLCSFLV